MGGQFVGGWRRVFVTAIVCLCATLGVVPSSAYAAPEDSSGEPSTSTLSLESLGLGNALAFYGLQGEITLSIPVPVGSSPAELTGTVELPPNLLRGYLTVMQDDRTIVRMPLPNGDLTPITIPLAGAEVVGNTVTLRLRAYLIPPPDNCIYDPTNPLRLANVAIRFAGEESPPRVVADFLPPILQRLTIFIPRTPSLVESDSAMRLITTVVAHYGQQNTDVTVVPLDGDASTPPTGAAPFERQIVIREGAPAAVALQPGTPMPLLLITGTAGDITNQVRVLTSDLSRLAASAKAVAGPLKSSPQIPTNLTTIRDLGQPGVNATDLTNPRVSIPLDQTRLGRSVRNLRVHLQGSYTPLPSGLGGQVLVNVWRRDAYTVEH
jgi:hypothetical protein